MTTRRGLLRATAGLAAAGTLARPAIAQSQAAKLGWLVALTGPGSSSGIGFNRGVTFALDEVNAAGHGPKLELITRDTQGDPTKCVNAAVELASRAKVNAIWGPVNSGEALACTPILARSRMPMMHPCVVDSLMNPAKFPNAFRCAPSNLQWGAAANGYAVKVLKQTQVALIGDTTGYGTSAVDVNAPMLKQMGATIVSQSLIEASQADLSADVLRMRDAGAKVIMVWSVNGGLLARLLNARGQLGWDVPVVGHPTLGSGEVKALLAKPAYWEKVYQIGYRSCSYDANGKLPERTTDFVKKIAGKIDLGDTSLWWVACGYDAVNLVARAVSESGLTNTDIIKYWNSLKDYPGVFGTYTFTPEQHNGYPPGDVVMSAANSFRDGAFALAPGYG